MVPRILLIGTLSLGTALTAPFAHSQDRGSASQTGQINSGTAHQPPSATPPQPIADPEDVRAALMMPDPGTISLGEQPNTSGKAQPETTGQGITSVEQPGPIGSTLQTMPAKFSHRNDAIDHTPIMGMPFKLDAQQRQKIFQAVMADDAPAAAETQNFKPADALPYPVTLKVRPLPLSLDDMPSVNKLDYLKGKDKVYLVTAATATPIVVDILDGK